MSDARSELEKLRAALAASEQRATAAEGRAETAEADVARHEGSGVVIEGIEDTVQLEAMKGLGVQALQGFLLGHPLPAEAFANSLSMRPMVVGR